VTNDNTDLLCGVFRQRTKRIVLYNLKAATRPLAWVASTWTSTWTKRENIVLSHAKNKYYID
jgi:hypothetical protein